MCEKTCSSDFIAGGLPFYSIPQMVSEFQSDFFSDSMPTDFKNLLEDSNGVELFKLFLKSVSAVHYLEFWFACQGFLKVYDDQKVYQLIKVIYRTFIRSESQKAVALKPNTKKNIVDKLSNKQCLDKTIFDIAQIEIRDILVHDFYPKFMNSEYYKLYQQNLSNSDNSKSSENTEQIAPINNYSSIEADLPYVEYCPAAYQPQKTKTERSSNTELLSKTVKSKQGTNTNNNNSNCPNKDKERRSIAEKDPLSFSQQLSSRLEKLRIMQQCGKSIFNENKYVERCFGLADTTKEDSNAALDKHCSFDVAADLHKCDPTVTSASMKRDPDIRSVVSHDSGVATNFEPQWYIRPPQPQPAYVQPNVSKGLYAAPRQYRHHHHHDHHHFRTRRRNRSEDQSVYSLEECGSYQVPCPPRKGKSQASDASSIFDSGVSSTYEQLSHSWVIPTDRVSNWVSNHPGIVNTPVEHAGHVRRSCFPQTPGYKDIISESGEPTGGPVGEVWIDACCMDKSAGPCSNTEKVRTRGNSKNKSNSSTTMTSDSTIVIGYYLCGDPVPYRTQVPCTEGGFTLGQFKQLLPKRGPFRYFFKRPCDEFEGGGAVHEEYTRDEDLLPMWEGKIVAKVEKFESL